MLTFDLWVSSLTSLFLLLRVNFDIMHIDVWAAASGYKVKCATRPRGRSIKSCSIRILLVCVATKNSRNEKFSLSHNVLKLNVIRAMLKDNYIKSNLSDSIGRLPSNDFWYLFNFTHILVSLSQWYSRIYMSYIGMNFFLYSTFLHSCLNLWMKRIAWKFVIFSLGVVETI